MKTCHVYWRLVAILTVISTNPLAIALEDTEKRDASRSSRVSVIRRVLPPLPSLDDPPGPSYPLNDKMSVQIPPNGLMNDEGVTQQQQSDQSQIDWNLEDSRNSLPRPVVDLYTRSNRADAKKSYLHGKLKLAVDAAHLLAFSTCVKPATKAGLVGITQIAAEDVSIGSQLFVKQSTSKAVQKEVMVTFNLTTTEAKKARLASALPTNNAHDRLENQIIKYCSQKTMVSGGSTSLSCKLEAVELDGVVTTATTTKQGYLAVGGPSFVVTGNIQLKFNPWKKEDIDTLKIPVCKGVAYSTGQPPQACRIISYELEYNKHAPKSEVEINFAFNLTILDHDYSKVAKSIDWYKHDDITNVVRWECQHDNISPGAKAGTMVVNVVEYSRANQGKSRAGYIGVFGELVLSVGAGSQDSAKRYTQLVMTDRVAKRYVTSAFVDALSESIGNTLDVAKIDGRVSNTVDGCINFTFQYLDLEAKVDDDVQQFGQLKKDIFDKTLMTGFNQVMSAKNQVSFAAIRSGFVKKITVEALTFEDEDGSPPPCHDDVEDKGDIQKICGTFGMHSDKPTDFQDDEKMQLELKEAFAKYSCSSAEEMSISVVPKIQWPGAKGQKEPLTERAFIRADSQAILRGGGPNQNPLKITPGQTLAQMKVTICAFAKMSRAQRVHFMLRHLPFNGIGKYIMEHAKMIRQAERIYTEPQVEVGIDDATIEKPKKANSD